MSKIEKAAEWVQMYRTGFKTLGIAIARASMHFGVDAGDLRAHMREVMEK